ncbi:MAG TPA: HPP family protein [Dehalococcoidales bacterium]|nr:HPP family protein [Dehalococcoidales bacterium]
MAMEIVDKSFVRKPRSYIVQSLLAVIAVAIILYFIEILTHAVIIAALGASTFIVFAMPNSVTAQPRRLIGGHAVGLICGTICYYAFLAGPLGRLALNWEFITWLACALAVGLSIFVMTITNTEHPPASATALSVVIYGWSFKLTIFVLAGAIGLAIARKLLGSRLKDLV